MSDIKGIKIVLPTKDKEMWKTMIAHLLKRYRTFIGEKAKTLNTTS